MSRHRRPALRLPSGVSARVGIVAAAVVLAVALGLGIGFGAPALADKLDSDGSRVTAPADPVLPAPALRPAGAQSPVPLPAGVAALLDPLVADADLGTFSGQVVDAQTGQVLWRSDPGRALVPGSTAKILTAAAALLTIDHQRTLDTTVVAGANPGEVVLVGGGDPTLTALPANRISLYGQPTRLDDLAEQVKAAAGGPVQRVLVDESRYEGDQLAPGWNGVDVGAGFVAPIVPAMLDGGRADPSAATSPRSSTPGLDLGAALARRLGADPAATALGDAPAAARELGTVSSPTIDDLVATMLTTSDNVLAEVLAREVAVETGAAPTFSGASAAVSEALTKAGFDTTTVSLVDGSGLSTEDRIPAGLLADIVSAAAGPDDGLERTASLRPLLAGLPVAGGSGTLEDRYTEAEADARGWVRAKTGTLTGVNSLAGTVLDADGRLIVFALMSNGPDAGTARPALDGLAAALQTCGCRG